MDNELKRLKKTAVQIRRDIIEATSHGKGGGIHVGPALSSVDLVTALYFKIMTVNPENPEWMQRDRFILSKGHAYAVWYSALAEKGFFPREELLTMRAINSRLQGHPAFRKTPGVDMTSGSLGNGLACGMGIAMAMKKTGSPTARSTLCWATASVRRGWSGRPPCLRRTSVLTIWSQLSITTTIRAAARSTRSCR